MNKSIDKRLEYFSKKDLDVDCVNIIDDDFLKVIMEAEYIDCEQGVYVSITSLDREILDSLQIDLRIEKMREFYQARELRKYLMLLEKRYYALFLLCNFYEIKKEMSEDESWEVFEHIWLDSEYLNRSVDTDFLIDIFRDNPKLDTQLEKISDRQTEDGLLEIYRGEGDKSNSFTEGALSWTLDKGKAVWFAKRFKSQGNVFKATVRKEHILAYFDERDEDEVIVDAASLISVEKVDLDRKYIQYFEKTSESSVSFCEN